MIPENIVELSIFNITLPKTLWYKKANIVLLLSGFTGALIDIFLPAYFLQSVIVSMMNSAKPTKIITISALFSGYLILSLDMYNKAIMNITPKYTSVMSFGIIY